MSGQYIFRQKITKDYVIIKNKLARNKKLTFEARGMLIYLLSQPPDWEVSKKDLTDQSPSAKNYAVARILKELEREKYILRKKCQNEKGHWEWVTYVFDQPYTEKQMSELDKECADILGPEVLERTKKTKEEGNSKVTKEGLTLAAAGIGEKDPLEDYPVDVKPRLAEFISVSEIKPTKRKKSFWIQTDREWGEMGVKVSDIKKMYDYAVENFGGVAGPQSITSAYSMMRTAKKPALHGEKQMRLPD